MGSRVLRTLELPESNDQPQKLRWWKKNLVNRSFPIPKQSVSLFKMELPESNDQPQKLRWWKKNLVNRSFPIPKQSVSLFKMKIPKYNTSFRNPCWYDEYKGKTTLRCFPYFYLAGFPKGGTSDLFSRMMGHPLVISGLDKATHHFTLRFYQKPLATCSSYYHCPSVSYSRKYFSQAAQLILATSDTKLMNSTFLKMGSQHELDVGQAQFMERFPQEAIDIWKEGQAVYKYLGIAVDGSPSAVCDFDNFRGIVENRAYGFPRNTSVDWIRNIFPGAKIILTLRDPVTRAFSHYTMRSKQRSSGSDFHEKVREILAELQKCFESEAPDLLCAAKRYGVRLHAGLYYIFVKSLFEKIPRDQVLLLKYEEYAADIAGTLAKIFEFLELPAISQEGLEFISKFELRHETPNKQAQMLPQTETLLANFYQPFNEKLAKFLNDDRFLWQKSKS